VRIYNGAHRRDTPQWSPDGSQFIINAPIRGRGQENFINIMDNLPYVGGLDLLLISRDGQIKRLTYFTVTSLMSVTDFVWSPDGQKIAFLLWDFLHSYEPSLMVVDIETGIVSDYCKLAEPPMNVEDIPVSLPDPVWSPDGRYLVFTEINEEYQYKVRLLELESGKAWDIAEDVSTMGWMMTP
jgi:Tol biopolymer transport system component